MKRILIFIILFSFQFALSAELPKNLKWETNDSDPTYADPNAKPGGTLRKFVLTFPMTVRTVGPDSNNSFRNNILDNTWALVGTHPNTRNTIPLLATHWSVGKDMKSMYFKINPQAKWSDGKPITADDFVFALEFMRSKNINAPWYNDFYSTEISKVEKYDTHTIGVFSPKKKPREQLILYLGIAPRPKHFYGGKVPKNYTRAFNWKPEPTTGPYYLKTVKKGKSMTLVKIKDWWAKDMRFIKGRFNPDKIIIKVIRNNQVAFEHFKKGNLDTYNLLSSENWFQKGDGKEYRKGYIEKTSFYTDSPRSNRGFYMNSDYELFKTKPLREAFSHALDIDLAIKKVFRSDVARLEHIYTGYGDYENKSIKARRFDIGKVKSIMAKEGWTRGGDGIWKKGNKRFSVKLTYGYPAYTDYLAFIKEQAKKAGVEIELDLLDGATSFKKIQEKKHQVSFSAWGVKMLPSPWESYHSDNAHKTQTNNISNTDDKELDALIDKYRKSVDRKEMVQLSRKIAQKVHDYAAFVPAHYFPFVRGAHWRWVRFPKKAGTNLSIQEFDDVTHAEYGGLMWIDEDLKKETLAAKKSGKTFPPVVRIDKANMRK